jgi:iron complex outermembrane receptor protein
VSASVEPLYCRELAIALIAHRQGVVDVQDTAASVEHRLRRRARPLGVGARIPGALPLAASALLAATPAAAQRADQNAVTAAEDAFGTSNGFQTVGLYSMNDARGFNPQQAGNLRLEGLYFSAASAYINQCLVRDTTMRIGIAAQSYSFPAPTGIADLRLYMPATETSSSAVLNAGSYGERGALVEGTTGVAEGVSAAGCVSYNHNFLSDLEALYADNIAAAGLLAWRPSADTLVLPFWSLMKGHDGGVIPSVYTDGTVAPPVYRPRELAVDGYSTQAWRGETGGVLLRHRFDATWSLAAGVFVSLENDGLTYGPEYLSVQPNRTADDELDVVPPLASRITSGEVRLSRRTGDGDHARTLEFSLRGRNADHEYGGDAIVDFGPAVLGGAAPAPPATLAFTPVSEDDARQVDAGVSYEERWKGAGSFALGLLKSDYRRTIVDPGSASVTDSAAPTLGSLRFTANAATDTTVYGSFVQGFEDSLLAPATASNRGQPPPATRTHQSDLGLRYAPSERVSLILGGFEIDKAYFNLDDAGLYTQLGEIRHRGLESSFNYAAQGVTLVAGGVWLRPHVERTLPEPGASGTVPIGPTPLTLTLNLDLAPPALKPFAAQLQLMRVSGGAATADDTAVLAPITVLNAELRYTSSIGGRPLSVRLDVQNALNAEGVRLTTVDQVMPQPARRVQLYFAIDN